MDLKTLQDIARAACRHEVVSIEEDEETQADWVRCECGAVFPSEQLYENHLDRMLATTYLISAAKYKDEEPQLPEIFPLSDAENAKQEDDAFSIEAQSLRMIRQIKTLLWNNFDPMGQPDERIEAFETLAHHPFFWGAREQDGKLIENMTAALDALGAKELPVEAREERRADLGALFELARVTQNHGSLADSQWHLAALNEIGAQLNLEKGA